MKSATAIAVLLAVSSLAGCVYTPQYQAPAAPLSQEPMATFDKAALEAGVRQGHAIIRGQAFSKTVGGDVKFGAGNNILIMPNTPYTSECISIIATSTSNCIAAIKPYTRSTQADGEGRFEFDGLAPGSYLMTTIITWGIPGPYGLRETGGAVTSTAEISSDTDIVTANLH